MYRPVQFIPDPPWIGALPAKARRCIFRALPGADANAVGVDILDVRCARMAARQVRFRTRDRSSDPTRVFEPGRPS